MSDKKQWGGPRKAGKGKKIGRPADPNRKQTVSVSVPPDVREYLRTVENISETVAEVIRKTKAFKLWKQAQSSQPEP